MHSSQYIQQSRIIAALGIFGSDGRDNKDENACIFGLLVQTMTVNEEYFFFKISFVTLSKVIDLCVIVNIYDALHKRERLILLFTFICCPNHRVLRNSNSRYIMSPIKGGPGIVDILLYV